MINNNFKYMVVYKVVMDYLQESLDIAGDYLRGNIMKRPIYRNNSPSKLRIYNKNRHKYMANILNITVHQYHNKISKWSKEVRARDKQKCVWCNETYGLVAHHIWHKLYCPESALDIDNGITLCHKCHMFQHQQDR